MPEGPEVRIVTEQLDQLLAGNWLLRVDWNERYKGNPELWANIRFPVLIENVTCKGKQIFFLFRPCSVPPQHSVWSEQWQLADRGNIPDYVLNCFLAMSGNWSLEPRSNCCCILTYCRIGQDGVPDQPGTLYFSDNRSFGHLTIMEESDYQLKLSKLGPDLLDGVEWPEYHQLVVQLRKDVRLADFLLEQKYFCGVGNYLRAEIMYACGLSPERMLFSLSDEELQLLWFHSTSLIVESYQSGGMTISDFHDIHGNDGKFQGKVYGQQYSPSGHPVCKSQFGGRTVHWVPEEQQ